ncbi:MAG: transposase [Bacilli bacterium]
MLNPLLTHQLNKKAVRKVKTDPIDTVRIAQAFYLGNGVPQIDVSEEIQELRVHCRQYHHWSGLYGEVQLHFRSVLDLLFPGNDKVFHKVCNPTSLTLLSTYPTPHAILSADQEDLLNILIQNRKGSRWNKEKLEALLSIARNSLPDPHA